MVLDKLEELGVFDKRHLHDLGGTVGQLMQVDNVHADTTVNGEMRQAVVDAKLVNLPGKVIFSSS